MPMLTLEVNVPLTRRKSGHYVLDETGRILFRANRLRTVIDWLVENDHYSFNLDVGDRIYTVEIDPVPQWKDQDNG